MNQIVKITYATTLIKTVEYDSLLDIQFAEPYFIKKDEWYKISFVWVFNRHNPNSYVVEFRDRHYTGHKVTFEFDDVPFNAKNGGSFLGGLKYCL